MAKKKKYTPAEQALFYSKRFLKVFVPLALVMLPTMGFSPESFAINVAVPTLTTLDKYMRNQGWYKI